LLLDTGDYHQKHQERHWDFPGGRIDVGEDPIGALGREMLEETGLTQFGEPELFTAVISKNTIKLEDSTKAGLDQKVYKISLPTEQKIVLSQEHTAFEWVDKKEAAKRLANKYPPEFTDLL
jgi:8-oxo-dGTP pyrophosphatase MutT (NUDIX family)